MVGALIFIVSYSTGIEPTVRSLAVPDDSMLPHLNCRPRRFVLLAPSSTGRARNLTHHPLQNTKASTFMVGAFFALTSKVTKYYVKTKFYLKITVIYRCFLFNELLTEEILKVIIIKYNFSTMGVNYVIARNDKFRTG